MDQNVHEPPKGVKRICSHIRVHEIQKSFPKQLSKSCSTKFSVPLSDHPIRKLLILLNIDNSRFEFPGGYFPVEKNVNFSV